MNSKYTFYAKFSNTGSEYIYQTDNLEGKGYIRYVGDNIYSNREDNCDFDWKNNLADIRKATYEEEKHLKACIKAKRFIPFNEINVKPIVEIYY